MAATDLPCVKRPPRADDLGIGMPTPQRRVHRFASAFLTVAMLLGLISVAGAASVGAEPAPPPDAFFDVPTNLADSLPGTVLKSRPVNVKQFQLLPLDVRAWQLLYRTTDADGGPDSAVTTVMIPRGEAKPRPLLSYQAATDSTLRICNPSYGLTSGALIEPANPAGPVTFALPAAEIAFAVAGLEQGWAVAMPDHGGVANRFLTPRQPGYAVLDGIRAVENFEPLALNGATTPVGLWGYSGGGIASSWAVEMQPEYAPELNIQGAALGAPERDLAASLRSVNATPLAGLIPVALSAIGKDDPEFAERLDQYLTPDGQRRVAEAGNHCLVQNTLSNLWFDYKVHLNQPLKVVLSDPIIRRAIDERGYTDNVPTAPLYVYNGVTEEVSPIAAVDKLVQGYCAGGATVTYRRETLPPRPIPSLMTTHGVVVITGAPNAFAWLASRLATDAPRPSGCDIQTVPTTLTTPDALSALGPAAVGILQGVLGQPLGSDW